MKKTFWSLCLLLCSFASVLAAPRDEDWQKVQDAMNKGLPKSAIEALNPIITAATAEKKYGEAVKAITRKIMLEGEIEGNKPEEKITRLDKEIAAAAPEIKPLLTTVQAHWYWQYFQQNRWRFMQRTATAAAPGGDFTTWDLPRLFAEIDQKFRDALAFEKILRATPVADYSEILEMGDLPDSYRPTVYDFIAYEALNFYTSGEQAAAKPSDAFSIAVDSPIFDNAERFLNWNPSTEETNSPALRAVRLYQDLLRFHHDDKDKSAFIDADMARLNYAENVAVGEGRPARFRKAMQDVAERWERHELAAMAWYHIASSLREEGQLVEAHRLATKAKTDYPKSNGANFCHNLIVQIEAQAVAVNTERVWNAPTPDISIRYKNTDVVYFRAVARNWERSLTRRWGGPNNLDEAERKEILAAEPALAWTQKLPATPDFKTRTESFPAPANLKPGFYFIIASYRADFTEKDNQIAVADVWVSDLALVLRNRMKMIEGFVLEANSGEPLKGATVNAWYHDNNGRRVAIEPLTTDENGFFQFKPAQNRQYLFRVKHNGRELGADNDLYANSWERSQPSEQTMLFTDRAIYRPGQSIQFKGICLRINSTQDDYSLVTGRNVTVSLQDANGQEVAKQTLRCNDFGSFIGTFTAPRDRLMGQMHLQAYNPNGQTYFRVEEYKRPKFQITLDAPKVAAKLNEKVSLIGHAMAYTGAAIDDAEVKYRVVREVRWPWWCWWGWYRSGGNQSQEIAHGTLRTKVDGTFEVTFTALPDLTAPEKDEPTFAYQIYADVTDSTGETRSEQRSILVGYTALQATLSAVSWQTDDAPVKLTIGTQTLDGEGQSASGVIKVYELKAPEKVQRPQLEAYYYHYSGYTEGQSPQDRMNTNDLSDPKNWPLGKMVTEKKFETDKTGKTTLEFRLKPGAFRVLLETKDRFGKKVTAQLPVNVLRPKDGKFALKIPNFVDAPQWTLQPGDELAALWGTGYEKGRAFVEIEHRNQMLQRYWTKPGRTQEGIRLAITEAMRGGFTLHVTQVRENRGYLVSRHVDVPWQNKELGLRWEHFTSKLLPGQKETWTAVIAPPTNAVPGSKKGAVAPAEKLAAEMVATLYDASLDQYAPHSWHDRFGIFYQDYTTVQPRFENGARNFNPWWHNWSPAGVSVNSTYRHFPYDLTWNYYGYRSRRMSISGGRGGGEMEMAAKSMNGLAYPAAAPMLTTATLGAEMRQEDFKKEYKDKNRNLADAAEFDSSLAKVPGTPASGRDDAGSGPNLNKVAARKNLNETAFFFPQLTSDSNGIIRLAFTMPEALTEWKFMGFAHDQQLRSGFLTGQTVTAKDLMVQPNPPRFLREGDTVEFTVKVSNQGTARQKGRVRLTFANGLTEKSVDDLLGNATAEKEFDIAAKESRSFSWRIKAPDGLTLLTYKAVAATDKISDGEEGIFPVLSRRIFVTESLPLPIRGPGEKKFTFPKLLASGDSDTLRHESVTVQMVSNPSWYAVMALPYLMEFPHECAEQTFNRLYANVLAQHIAKSDPKIHRIFELWRNTPALDSPLEKNEELKSVALLETPWVRQAQNESQARRNVGILFDDNRLANETSRAQEKLAAMQIDDGNWPWFPGGKGNEYITLYITTGFGRLRHLGVDVDTAPAVRSLDRLDNWINETYRYILSHHNPDENHLSPTIALYLYGRSFFLKDKVFTKEQREAVDYFLGQARKYWVKMDNRQSQGHLAIALHRFDDTKTARGIIASLKEHSVSNEEMGMFWRDLEFSWWWYRAPIETQALMIEAFDEVTNDTQAVEDCKVWLLKQKQTQDWKTTKATADAVYALLLRGTSQLASDALVEVNVGGINLTPGKEAPSKNPPAATPVEAGTGFYQKRFPGAEVKPNFGEITVKKVDQGVAWGSLHWQYLEDMTKVTPHEDTPLKLKKTLFKKVNTNRGPVLEAVKDNLAVGDELVVRIELRTDRDMEYIHMKDQRGSGTEPVNVLSQYKYQDGLGYYESTRDTASHFYIDYLPKGTYVFEYSTRVQLRGEYQSGIAEIQCMYAPEFNSHSESFGLTVK